RREDGDRVARSAARSGEPRLGGGSSHRPYAFSKAIPSIFAVAVAQGVAAPEPHRCREHLAVLDPTGVSSAVHADLESVVCGELDVRLRVESPKAENDDRRRELDDDDPDTVELVQLWPIAPSAPRRLLRLVCDEQA